MYCEKRLTHSIYEARRIREEAAKSKVATQMGIQIHATENYRRVVELVQAGTIGPIREVHVWVSRAWGLQSPEAAKKHNDIVTVAERPKQAEPVPMGLDWDVRLGPAPERPFHSVYVPGPKWYRWWDFGSGTMSDLDLQLPEKNFEDFQAPAPTIARASGHHAEWIEACKPGKPALANFEYSGWLTEANHLGNLAYRVGKKLEWDAVNMRAKNAPEAIPLIQRAYRKGWEL